jgi:hypothetical protein
MKEGRKEGRKEQYRIVMVMVGADEMGSLTTLSNGTR